MVLYTGLIKMERKVCGLRTVINQYFSFRTKFNPMFKPKMVKLSLISEVLKSLIVLMEQVSLYQLSDKRLWTTFITLLSKQKVFQLVQLVHVPILAETEFSSRSAALVSLLPWVAKVTSGTHVLTDHWLLLT